MSTEDAEIDALQEEFPPYSVWTDWRPRDDGEPHWHARKPGDGLTDMLHALDAADMRDKLIMAKRLSAGSPDVPAG